ncbi:Peptidyl-prolyl cis-trans isomerase FKBP12 (PPIase FKBP12) (12 kDa FK506-binding protein) (12 kDa FKBP) (FK506-binding protein 12) (AtFKBP12) (FKBP-12) (Immunophilin FKBP12) (Rotamase) [Durusdinium trenchii]|uniref:peptidylprolyl isomerase n=1 Tax=Durusdinium trenchii TaxID=1381693 RepID=A0ABP0R9D3_9DINO
MDKMTPEEADEYQMRRGGLQKERKDAKGEQQEFEYQAIPGCDTVYTVLKDRHAGATVEPGDEVTVHATGLVTATKSKFWSTKDAGQQPFTYICGGGVIKGWDMGARGMKKGEARGLRIPAGEGYGGRGFPSWGIPPNADLLFEIEVGLKGRSWFFWISWRREVSSSTWRRCRIEEKSTQTHVTWIYVE